MVGNWDGDGKTYERGFDMRWHIVIAFYRVLIERFTFLDKPVEAIRKIFPDCRIIVFING